MNAKQKFAARMSKIPRAAPDGTGMEDGRAMAGRYHGDRMPDSLLALGAGTGDNPPAMSYSRPVKVAQSDDGGTPWRHGG
ncbi:MAG: hypothetical protein HQ481_08415 [Alphaproteobacteria bacterium]|nr:hypothetical protein [Alphaproteobacteria bacterium]